MKLIIAGSRGFHRPVYLIPLEEAISSFEYKYNTAITEIVHGGNMQSADYLGWLYGAKKNLKVTVFPADWDTHGKKAGILRNIQMSEYADGLVTLWNGNSPGTKHMQTAMQAKNKPHFIKIIKSASEEELKKFTSSFPLDATNVVIKSLK